MENIHGKEISLQYVTVKVPGQKPRGSRTIGNLPNGSSSASEWLTSSGNLIKGEKKGEKVLLTGYEPLREPSGGEENDVQAANSNTTSNQNAEKSSDTPNVKKRHRRIKSNGVKANQDGEGNGNCFCPCVEIF